MNVHTSKFNLNNATKYKTRAGDDLVDTSVFLRTATRFTATRN